MDDVVRSWGSFTIDLYAMQYVNCAPSIFRAALQNQHRPLLFSVNACSVLQAIFMQKKNRLYSDRVKMLNILHQNVKKQPVAAWCNMTYWSIMQFFDNVLFKILYLENKIRETILSFLTELSC